MAWPAYAADGQSADPGSMLTLYREALRLRREEPGFAASPEETADGRLGWLPSAPGVLAFGRTHGLICVVNLSGSPVPLPESPHEILLTSGPLDPSGLLPDDTAAWLRGKR